MFDFKTYFQGDCELALTKASYDLIAFEDNDAELSLLIEDSIASEVKEDKLYASFTRLVHFEPEALYAISVSFEVSLQIKDPSLSDEVASIDWNKILVEEKNPFISNMVCRASQLISAMTSSYGQQPLITPPRFMKR